MFRRGEFCSWMWRDVARASEKPKSFSSSIFVKKQKNIFSWFVRKNPFFHFFCIFIEFLSCYSVINYFSVLFFLCWFFVGFKYWPAGQYFGHPWRRGSKRLQSNCSNEIKFLYIFLSYFQVLLGCVIPWSHLNKLECNKNRLI